MKRILSALMLLVSLYLSNDCYSQQSETVKVSSYVAQSERGTAAKDSLLNINPFKKFVGEWTLKNDDWTQNWGGATEHIKIPGHHTINRNLNTANSLLSVIDGTPPFGHIFWTYNPVKKQVHHLSSFGELRCGVGTGTINENGDVTLKVSFEGEAEGTYRIYTYKWNSDNEYKMTSIQYNSKNEPTGFLYEGTFVRIIK